MTDVLMICRKKKNEEPLLIRSVLGRPRLSGDPAALRTCLLGALLAMGAGGCSSSAASPSSADADVPRLCANADGFCAGLAYTLCVDVQPSRGRCVDWSRVGATPCPGGAGDCPTMLPMASFSTGSPSQAIAVCVMKDKYDFRDPGDAGPPEPGYCAGFQSSFDPGGS
jgi:hypothetical protein